MYKRVVSQTVNIHAKNESKQRESCFSLQVGLHDSYKYIVWRCKAVFSANVSSGIQKLDLCVGVYLPKTELIQTSPYQS